MSQDAARSLGTYQLIGAALVIFLVCGFGGWAAWASINGAVIANATVVVETYSKKVQHIEGGIVSEIFVRDGDRVKAGALLLRLDQTEHRAELAIINARLNELLASEARLKAERDGAETIQFPVDLTTQDSISETESILAGQQKLFAARADERQGKKGQLRQRVGQLDEEILGLHAQKEALEQQIKLIAQELEGLYILRKKKLVPTTRLLALQREASKLEGERGSLISEIARSKGKIVETELAIIQVDQESRTEVLTDLREVQTNLAEYLERRSAARTKLRRTEIYAPQAGVIHQLMVHTVGGVIAAGEPVMLIVPERDSLVLEAQVAPADIAQVKQDQQAVVRFASFDQRTTPELSGKVINVSADLTRASAETPPYYTARVALSKDELSRLGGKTLKPGMPAEVFIQTGARTALSYLLKPLSDQIARTFRER